MRGEFRDWSDVRVFLAVLRAGSTLAASKALGLAQPTVARRIEALEHALGLTLFERDTRGFQPTADALALVASAEALETAARTFAAEAGLRGGRSRVIRITTSDTFGGQLQPILEAFVAAHPGTLFEVISSERPLDLSAGEADVAIRIAEVIGDEALICRRLRTIGLSLVASKAYAARRPLPASEAELGGHMFVLYRGHLSDRASQQWVRSRIGPAQIAMEVGDLKAAEGAVALGAGIAVMPARRSSLAPAFVRCFDLPDEVSLSSWLLIGAAAWRRPEVKAFAAFLAPRFRALPYEL
jgi:DNA-binding transcriptional LysR family regulator